MEAAGAEAAHDVAKLERFLEAALGGDGAVGAAGSAAGGDAGAGYATDAALAQNSGQVFDVQPALQVFLSAHLATHLYSGSGRRPVDTPRELPGGLGGSLRVLQVSVANTRVLQILPLFWHEQITMSAFV